MATTRPTAGSSWRSLLTRAATAAVSLTVMTGCGGPGADAPPAAEATPTAVKTDVGDSAATLTLFTGAGTKGFYQGLGDAFMAKYPKVSVKLQVEADNNYNTVLPRLLVSDSPPDLVAPADLIGAVEDGLLTNLDAYDKAYGWASKVPESALNAGRVDNGVIGSGSLYLGGGSAGPLVGVFFNRDVAKQVGMTQPPATLQQFESSLAKAKAAGVTPIVASNADGLIGHLYSLLLATHMGPEKLLDVVWNRPGATLETPEGKQATELLAKWMKAGYFNADANAINQDASYGQFAAGKGLFMVQGTWITQSLPKAFDGKYGIFPLPPKQEGGQQVSMTGNQLALAIAAKSKRKDAAALFLNFLTTPEAAKVAADNGYPSVAVQAPSVTLDSPVKDQIQAGYSKVAKDNGFTSWLQNAGPAMTPAVTAQLQSLLGGKTTPEQAVTKLQSTYAAK